MSFPPVFNPKATRAESHRFEIGLDEQIAQDAGSLQAALSKKLTAEDSRLRRLIPDPPEGYHWVPAIEYSEDARMNTITYRIVYRLKEIS